MLMGNQNVTLWPWAFKFRHFFKAVVAMLAFVLRKLLWLVIIAEWIITGGRKEMCNSTEMILEPTYDEPVLILFWSSSIVTESIILVLPSLLCLFMKGTASLLSRLSSLLTFMSRKTLRTWWVNKTSGGLWF